MPRPIAARWNEPEEFWAEAAEAIDWERRWDRVLDDSRAAVLPLVRRGAPQHLLERARPACRGGTRRAGRADLGQPGHRRDRALHLSRDARPDGACRRDAGRARGAARRPRADLYADGAGGGDRDARLRPDRRGAFGRVRRVRGARAGDPHRRRAAARRSWPPPAASRSTGSSRTSRCSTRRSPRRASKPEACVVLQRPMCRAELVPGRDHDWQELEAAARPADCVPVAGDRSALHPLYLGHDRHPERRRARQWRARRRARLVDARTSTACSRTRCSGPPRMSAGWSAIRISSTGR